MKNMIFEDIREEITKKLNVKGIELFEIEPIRIIFYFKYIRLPIIITKNLYNRELAVTICPHELDISYIKFIYEFMGFLNENFKEEE